MLSVLALTSTKVQILTQLAAHNAVLGIGLLTQSTRATLIDAPGEEPEGGGRERPSVSGSGDARSDRAEAPSACSSVAERYLRLKEEDWDHAVPQRTYARALVLTAEPEGCSRSEVSEDLTSSLASSRASSRASSLTAQAQRHAAPHLHSNVRAFLVQKYKY